MAAAAAAAAAVVITGYMEKRSKDSARKAETAALDQAINRERVAESASSAQYEREMDAWLKTYYPDYHANRSAGRTPAAGAAPAGSVAPPPGGIDVPIAGRFPAPQSTPLLPEPERANTLGAMMGGPAMMPQTNQQATSQIGPEPVGNEGLAGLANYDWRRNITRQRSPALGGR